MHRQLYYFVHKPSNIHHYCLILNRRQHQNPAICASSGSGLQVASKRAAKSALLSTRLSRCTDLAAIHALLLQLSGRTHDALPGVVRTQLATDTRPADAVAAFRHLAARWRSSAQGPIEAALLSDALQPAYALLNVHLALLQPHEVAAIINSLAGLRSANPEVLRRLADSLARRPAPGAAAAMPQQPLLGHVLQQSLADTLAPVSTSLPSHLAPSHVPPPHFPSSPALAAAAATSGPEEPLLTIASAAAAASPSAVAFASAASGLARLTSPELAAVVSALAAFNLRPGDAWLGLCMSCLQLGLPSLSGPQLAQLLWALVQLGVRPTSPWLALYEEALSRCLERHLEKLDEAMEEPAPAREMARLTETQGARQLRKSRFRAPDHHRQQQKGQTTASAGRTGSSGELSCEDLVRVVSASAEVAFQPGERCRTLLLAALGSRLREMQPHQVAGLAWGVTRLGWQVDGRWRDTFLQVTWSLFPQLRAADLTAVLDFVAGARLSPGRAWLRRCLETSLAHLPQVSPRDLPGLLGDLTQLDERLFSPRVTAMTYTATTAAAPAVNGDSNATGGGAAVALDNSFPGPAAVVTALGTRTSEVTGALATTAAAAATRPGPGYLGQPPPPPQQQQQGAMKGSKGKAKRVKGANGGCSGDGGDEGEDGAERGLEALAAAWLRRYLQLCTEKLSRFTAGGVAQMMVAVARSGGLADDRWLEATCATLASKSDVLGATDMADAVIALAALRRRRLEVHAVRPSARKRAPAAAAVDAVGCGGVVTSASTSTSPAAPLAAAAVKDRIERDQGVLLEALLSGCATKLSLLPDDRLVGLVAALAKLDVRPNSTWLGTLLDITLARMRMKDESAAPSAPQSLTSTSPPPAPSPSLLSPPAPAPAPPNPQERSLREPATPEPVTTSSSPSPSAAGAAESDQKSTPSAPLALPSGLPSVRTTGLGSASSRGFSPRLLSELLVSVAKLGVSPPRRWSQAFLEAAGRQLEGFDATSLSGLLWGLVVLDIRPSKEWTTRLMEHVHKCLSGEESRSGAPGGAAWRGGYDVALSWAVGHGPNLMFLGEEWTGGRLAKPAAEERDKMPTVMGLGMAEVQEGEAAGSAEKDEAKGKEEGIRPGADSVSGEGEVEKGPGGWARRVKRYGYLHRRYSTSSNRRALSMTV
ncbi:hypothetical protein VaNZ11_004278 [Volvox africanus]|uniref:Uncharacterized protein n=1 Tax=Volvox africanus TaxID=51714 RepID=A0ABQ5RVX1_9CHLO|nr:hypothetical protein VaNZ11_004278 [Volvox africanus]